MTRTTDSADGDDTESGGALGQLDTAPRPRHYTPDEVLRTLSLPVRKSLMRVLAFPLAAGLFFAVHPWSYLPSANDSPQPTPTQDVSSAPTADAPPESPSATDARSQAEEVNSILEQSASHRETVQSAVNDTLACSRLSSAAESFQKAADARDNLFRQAAELTLHQIDGGPDLVDQLKAALGLSARADVHFASWAIQMQSGSCTESSATKNEDYIKAMKDSEEATKAKKDFLTVWNPIAKRHGLRSWGADELF